MNSTVGNDSHALQGFGRKTIGRGVCLYKNSSWCKKYIVRSKINTDDIELLSVSLRPTYLPREFGQIYISPDANYKAATETIYQHVQDIEDNSPDAPKIILQWLFINICVATLPTICKCNTKRSQTIDLCYGNIKGYKAIKKSPPIGASDRQCF